MYEYKELREKALSDTATKKERLSLLEWFEKYGDERKAWNGESWDIDEGLRLYPIYKEVEKDSFEVVDAEIR